MYKYIRPCLKCAWSDAPFPKSFIYCTEWKKCVSSCLQLLPQLLSHPETKDPLWSASFSSSSKLHTFTSPRLIPKVMFKHTHMKRAFVDLGHSCTRNSCWYTQSGHTTFLRSAICHVEKNLQSSSVCCRLRLKAFLWKFMPKQLWSHPPVCRPWRQRCPRNYERDPIHYTAPVNFWENVDIHM